MYRLPVPTSACGTQARVPHRKMMERQGKMRHRMGVNDPPLSHRRGEETPGHGSEMYNLIRHQGDTVMVSSAIVQKAVFFEA